MTTNVNTDVGGADENSAFSDVLNFAGDAWGAYWKARARIEAPGAQAVLDYQDRDYARGRTEKEVNKDFIKWLVGALGLGALLAIVMKG